MNRASDEITLSPVLLARFWSRVDRSGECWIWTAGKSRGYGSMKYSQKKQIYAHRLSWIISNGPIPKDNSYHGWCVMHICDNPPCVNPSHLRIGTTGDNIRDSVAKGRWPDRRGERHPCSKLKSDNVKEIVKLLPTGLSHRTIGERYGVSTANIDLIKSGKNWAHLTGLMAQ